MPAKGIPLLDTDRQSWYMVLGQRKVAECKGYLFWQPSDKSWYFGLDVWGIPINRGVRVAVDSRLVWPGAVDPQRHFDGMLWCRALSDSDARFDPVTRDAFWRRTHILTWETTP